MQEIADRPNEEGARETCFVFEDTNVGMEKTEASHPGQGPEDVARLIREGVERRKLNVE